MIDILSIIYTVEMSWQKTQGNVRTQWLTGMCVIAIREQMNGIERDRRGGEVTLAGRDWF